MATRGGAARRIPGNPLGGILRDSQRAARAVSGPRAATLYAAHLTTDDQGKVTVLFPVPFIQPPVVQLTVGAGGDGVVTPAVANVLEFTALGLSLVVWTLDGAAVGSGFTVHATAYERT